MFRFYRTTRSADLKFENILSSPIEHIEKVILVNCDVHRIFVSEHLPSKRHQESPTLIELQDAVVIAIENIEILGIVQHDLNRFESFGICGFGDPSYL